MMMMRLAVSVVSLICMDVVPTFLGSERRTETTMNLLYAVCGVILWFCFLGGWQNKTAAVLPMVLRRWLHGWVTKTWPKFVVSQRTGLEKALRDGGPLGPGSGKLVEILVGMAVFFGSIHAFPSQPETDNRHHTNKSVGWWAYHYAQPGPVFRSDHGYPWWLLPGLVLVLSVLVNVVLWLWSFYQQSRGTHEGVHRLVHKTVGRPLTLPEQTSLVAWAMANALCEEIECRALNRAEFQSILVGSASTTTMFSNLLQATVFGLSHYHGIPSGWTGVVLCFVYGLLMGLLANAGGGLLYPVATHTVADYFIFSQIARQRLFSNNNNNNKDS